MCIKFSILFIAISFFAVQTKAQDDGGFMTGRYLNTALREVSGMAASRVHPNTFYVHNDSGDTSRFFAVNEKGELKGIYYFKGDEVSFSGVNDCEDITIGSGPDAGKEYIYLADIGDNAARRLDVRIFRIEEPGADSGVVKTVGSQMFTLTYPNGAQDAETIMIDPTERLLYIVSKRQDSVIVYTAPLDLNDKKTYMLREVCKLYFDGKKKEKWIVSGSISRDGKQVMLKSMKKVYYWQRQGNESIYKTMQRTPLELSYTQHGQEEAICFSPDGKSYFITGEGEHAGIYHYDISTQELARRIALLQRK
ncbi:hypothetical protein [Pinibacter soli]|uniref:Uncharacterized protein n=1 Tax=Pinibacter soli TaxID=3044211 RepID=A0ABT6RAX1_9BACT|nr:hypothetical protein [Pinibacter soli]MDI3319717.1 hypothetical protein [Pinibacter soli]